MNIFVFDCNIFDKLILPGEVLFVEKLVNLISSQEVTIKIPDVIYSELEELANIDNLKFEMIQKIRALLDIELLHSKDPLLGYTFPPYNVEIGCFHTDVAKNHYGAKTSGKKRKDSVIFSTINNLKETSFVTENKNDFLSIGIPMYNYNEFKDILNA